MLSKKVRTLIEGLHEKTKGKLVEWERVSWGDAYETALADFNVILARGADNPNHPRAAECFRLRIVDEGGTDLLGVTLSPEEHGSHERFYHLAKQLYALIEEHSSGADEALDTILSALDSL